MVQAERDEATRELGELRRALADAEADGDRRAAGAEREARRAEAAEAAVEAALAEAARARDEQSIERKGLVAELHQLHVLNASLNEQVESGRSATLQATHDQRALLAERSLEHEAAKVHAAHAASLQRQLQEAREGFDAERHSLERKLAAERAEAGARPRGGELARGAGGGGARVRRGARAQGGAQQPAAGGKGRLPRGGRAGGGAARAEAAEARAPSRRRRRRRR